MILFRSHRGSYNESMKTVKQFATVDEMKDYIASKGYSKENIEIEKYHGEDTRNGWDTHYVLENGRGCIGMCAEVDDVRVN